MPSSTFGNPAKFSGSDKQANNTVELNSQTIFNSFTFPSGYNGLSAGPITIATGVTVTIPTGVEWSIV